MSPRQVWCSHWLLTLASSWCHDIMSQVTFSCHNIMLPGLVHDNPRDGGPGCVPGAVTLTNLHLDLAHLLTSGHFLHQNLMMQLTVISSDFLSCSKQES